VETRRSFIGQVLGTLVGSQIPFVMREAAPKRVIQNTKLDSYERMLRGFRVSEETLLRWRLIAVTHPNRELVWMPPLVKATRDIDKGKIKFEAQDLHVTGSIVFDGCQLVDDRGYFVREAKFSGTIYMVAGDSLRITHTLHLFGG
jgi:hypothetical protein